MLQVIETMVNKMNKILMFVELTIGEVGRGQIMQGPVAMLRNIRFIWILF